MKLPPIVLFVYNRPWHTQRTVEALIKNELADQSDLIIYSDGPKDVYDRIAVKEVRQYIRGIEGFKCIKIIEHVENQGLADSIITGVTEVVNEYDQMIVLEDDLVTSPFFLRFMNDGLRIYKNEKKVISINGYIYPIKNSLPETFFLRGADCWGWGTWKRGWDLFQKDGQKLLDELKKRNLTRLFDYNGAYAYTKMLKDQILGKNNSWAIRWHASAFLNGLLTLYPGRPLVQNIGIDRSGVHCGYSEKFDIQLSNYPIKTMNIPIVENSMARGMVENFLKSTSPSIISKIKLLAKNTLTCQ